MDNPYSVLEQDDFEEGEQKVVEFFRFNSLVPDVKIELSDSNFHLDRYRKSSSLLTCSSKYGYFIAGSLSGFVLGQTEHLRAAVYNADRDGDATPFDNLIKVSVKEGQVNIVALTCDSLQLLVGVSGGILLTYNISDIIKNKENVSAVQSQTLDAEIIYIQPNPEVCPDVVAVATQNDECKLIRYMTSEIMATLTNTTTMSWSPKGKQIVCGTRDARLFAYDTEGNQKDDLAPPPSKDDPDVYVNAVLWVENHVFLAIYSKATNGEHSHKPYMINRKATSVSDKYVLMGEINPIYDFECPDSHFYISLIRDFGTKIKTMIVLANSAAGELAIIGQDEQGQWSTWMPDGNIPSLPLSEDDVTDTYPIGLTIDFSASELLPPFDSAEDETPVPPMPVVLFMSNEGRICAYHAYNSDLAELGEKYAGMVTADDINTIPEPAAYPQVPEATATVAASAFRNSENPLTFGGAISKIPAFSSLGTTATITKPSASTPTFGSAQSSTPTFGSTSSVGFGAFGAPAGSGQTVSFASLAKSASTNTSTSASASAFGYGGTTNVGSTFGETSAFGVLGSKPAAQAPTFGSFGVNPATEVPAFGSLSSFGSFSTKPSSDTPTFGSTSSFGAKTSTNAPTFGSGSSFGVKSASSFGSTSTVTHPFGSTAFGTSETQKKLSVEEAPIFGVPKGLEGCSLNFEKVQQAIEDQSDSGSEISKVSSIDKSKDAFGFSLDSVSDALNSTVEADELILQDTSSIGESNKEDKVEKKIAEENKLEKEKRIEQETQYAEEKQALEENLIEEHKKETKEKKITDENSVIQDEREKIDNENIMAEEKRIAFLEQKKLAEDTRAAEEKRLGEERIAEQLRLEEERIAEERRRKEAEERRLEKEHIAEEQRLEEKRIAEERRLQEERIAEEEKLASIKPDLLFAVRERFETMYPAEHERATGILGIAKEFESIYFDTEDALETTSYHLEDIEEDIMFQERSRFVVKDIMCLEDHDYQWKMIDMSDTSTMMDTLNTDAIKADEDLRSLFNAVASLLESTDRLRLDDIKACLKAEETNPKSLDSIKQVLQNDVKYQLKELQTKSTKSKENLDNLEKKLEQYKQDLKSVKSNQYDESKITAYTLRRTIRDIEKSISVQNNKISCLEQEELSLRLNFKLDDTTTQTIPILLSAQKGAFVKQVFFSLQKLGKPLIA